MLALYTILYTWNTYNELLDTKMCTNGIETCTQCQKCTFSAYESYKVRLYKCAVIGFMCL